MWPEYDDAMRNHRWKYRVILMSITKLSFAQIVNQSIDIAAQRGSRDQDIRVLYEIDVESTGVLLLRLYYRWHEI